MIRMCTAIGVAVALAALAAATPSAQSVPEAKAIRARLHGTFLDSAGGLGVLSGDITFSSFEERFGSLTAIGEMEGALADSRGEILGRVDQEVSLIVSDVRSTCNQVRLGLIPADVDVLGRSVHLDEEVAGYDSRQGAVPRAQPSMCRLAAALDGGASPQALADILNGVIKDISGQP